MTTQKITVQLSREHLADDFKIIDQSFNTNYNLEYALFQKLEHKINVLYKDTERFVVKVELSMSPIVHYRNYSFRKSVLAKITCITDFANKVILSEDIQLN